MKISEQQLLRLIYYTNCLASRMAIEKAPYEESQKIEDLLITIANQQSEELKEIK